MKENVIFNFHFFLRSEKSEKIEYYCRNTKFINTKKRHKINYKQNTISTFFEETRQKKQRISLPQGPPQKIHTHPILPIPVKVSDPAPHSPPKAPANTCPRTPSTQRMPKSNRLKNVARGIRIPPSALFSHESRATSENAHSCPILHLGKSVPAAFRVIVDSSVEAHLSGPKISDVT